MTSDTTPAHTDTPQDRPDDATDADTATASSQPSNPNFIANDLDRVPDRSFRDYGLDDRLVDALEAKGITHPFPIQELTLPVALKGQDIIGQARTGTGKTLGFGLPMIQRLDPDADHTQALIVTPTRELCIQVYEELRICEAMGFTSTTVYGGVGYEEQIEALDGGVDIVVGTPGRLLDMLGRGHLDLSRVGCVILDEADEMLDMGFLPDVERLLDAANEEGRHTMLFSATMPASVVKLARRYTDGPLFMGADTVEHETAPTVEQHFFQVFRMDKPRLLARILQQPDRGNAYVFCRTKAMCDRLVRELDDLGVNAIAIHGDLRQAAREKNLGRFRDGSTSVLVATEVAARGIDVENVTHVFNYDIPDDEKMYLHRIGRTARKGLEGVAVTFAEHSELARLQMIINAVQQEDMDELEVHEVFSTSDLLVELFDLPAETPWDHLGASSGGSRSSGSASRGQRSSGAGARGGRDGGRRGGSSRDDDRRGSSSRSRSRVEHDSGDDDGRDRRRSRTVVRDSSEDGRSGSSGSSGDREARGSGRDRTRTRRDDHDRRDGSRTSTAGADERTRSRQGGETTNGGRVRARGGRPVEGRTTDGDRDGGRTRSRDRSRSGSGGSRDGGSRSRTSDSGERSSRSRGSSGGAGGRSSDGGSSNRSGGTGRSSSGGGGSRGGSRRGSSSSRSNRGSGGGKGKGSGSGSGQREGRVSLPRDVRPTKAGTGARGDGQPRHERSVHVDELA